VAHSARGNLLYIADAGNNKIRQVDLDTHVITTIAGNGQAGYSGDGGAPTSAKFNCPGGLTVDPVGDLYISDTGNDVIRKLTFTPIVKAAVGNQSIGGTFSGDGGVATSAGLSGPLGLTIYGGNLYFADTANAKVRVAYNGGGSGNNVASTSLSQLGWFITPISVQIDGNGYMYVADGDWGGILKWENFDTYPILLGDVGPALSIALNRSGSSVPSSIPLRIDASRSSS
jgi:sugar lactone lactonase YvrE